MHAAIDAGECRSVTAAPAWSAGSAANHGDKGCGSITLEPTQKMEKKPAFAAHLGPLDQHDAGLERYGSLSGRGKAMIAALMPLASDLTIGAIFFPSEKPGANDDSVCIIRVAHAASIRIPRRSSLRFSPARRPCKRSRHGAERWSEPMYGPVGGMAALTQWTATIGQTPTTEALLPPMPCC